MKTNNVNTNEEYHNTSIKEVMNEIEHKSRHEQLHKALDELIADFITHTGLLPSQTVILELMQWSFQQTTNPSVKR